MTGKKRSVDDMQKSNNISSDMLFHDKSLDLDDFEDEESVNDSPHSSEPDNDNDDLSDFEWQEPIVNDSETEDGISDLGKSSYLNVTNNEKSSNFETANESVSRFKQYRSTIRYAESDDSSDEEDLRNTVGNIPMKWYEDFPHIGYNLDGKPILKPIRNQDELDKFLDKMENPDYWRTIYDKTTDRNHVLTEDEIQLINRVKSGKFFDANYDPHEPYIDFFTHEKMIHPVNNFPEHKRSFVPSILEKRKVGKLVHAIKMGWLKPRKPKPEFEEKNFYDLWSDVKDDPKTHRELARQKMHIPAPKMTLPGHSASYNPAPEYLPNEEEIKEWKENDPEDRKEDFIPTKFDCLRKVPQYPNFIKERFSRCLDLYLCPRQRRMKINIDPEDLIPKLPKPSDLKPFPTFQTLCYRGHKEMVLTISVDVSGQWLASGSKDGVVRVWEVATARCVREIVSLSKTNPIRSLAWCPNASVCLLAVAVGNTVVIVNPSVGDRVVYHSTDKLIESFDQIETTEGGEEEEDGEKRRGKSNAFIDKWKILSSGEKFYDGQRIIITHPKDVGKVTWHSKGDYFAAAVPENGNSQVFLHQLTRLRSQNPFSKCKGDVQAILFHPIRPFFFVATKKYVRVYNLTKRELTKKMTASANWISSIAVHPGGDNLVVGAYNSRLSWLDMDLSTKPYQTMVYHRKAVRACCFHRKYPLFASAGDDCSIVVSHGMVYSDLLQNALIVPVKVLKGHQAEGIFGIMDLCFHPHQPWVFSAGADHTIRLYT